MIPGRFKLNEQTLKPGLHIVRRIVSMSLRPCPKEHIRHLKQDDAFNRTWWSVLSIDKLVTWQHLPIERTGGHVVLKASSCSRSLLQLLRCRLQKSLVKDCYYQKHALPCEKKLHLNRSYYPHWESGPWMFKITSVTPSVFVTQIPALASSYCRSWNEFYFPDRCAMHAMSRKAVSNCFSVSLWFRFVIQLGTRLETCLQWWLESLQLEETEQLITMPVKLAML